MGEHEGTVKVIDFMPIRQTEPDLIRIVEGVGGQVRMGVELVARFDYGRVVPWVRHAGGRWVGVAGPDSLWLDTPVGSRAATCAAWRSSPSTRASGCPSS